MTNGVEHWPDPQATAAVRRLLRRHRAVVDTVLLAARLDGLEKLADAAAEYVAAPEGPCTPEGAAVVFAIAQFAGVTYRIGVEREREFIDRFVDSWMIEHGHTFVRDVVEARRAVVVERPEPVAGRMTPWLRQLGTGEEAAADAEALSSRVRVRLAAAPVEEAVRTDPKSVTTDQIRRFEAAMVDGRRWRVGAHRRLVAEDPALGPLAARLVWASFDKSGTAGRAFRMDAEHKVYDVDGVEVELAVDGLIGVAHPIHLGEAIEAWRDVFADKRLRQPFEQLERQVYKLTPDESESNSLSRFASREIRTDRMFALQESGWEVTREALYRRFSPTREVTVALDPGLEGGLRYEAERQRILSVELRGGTFGMLDPVAASELIRQLERLAA
ncbi:DUF4132 domain-containing protein [Nocardia concava]|uniref:DUF4132 domain-containing protein n=1 Tax=Nocardia concava TaxID=257281 RepID=UPI0005930A48|nr:DUF4132 domain-containing protein [Nocardia concava]